MIQLFDYLMIWWSFMIMMNHETNHSWFIGDDCWWKQTRLVILVRAPGSLPIVLHSPNLFRIIREGCKHYFYGSLCNGGHEGNPPPRPCLVKTKFFFVIAIWIQNKMYLCQAFYSSTLDMHHHLIGNIHPKQTNLVYTNVCGQYWLSLSPLSKQVNKIIIVLS